MKRRNLLATMVAGLVWSCAQASAQPLVIDGLEASYTDVSEVRLWLRNAGAVRLYLNSFAPDRIEIERQADDDTSWVRGASWTCANAGAGSRLSLPPGGSVELRIISTDAFDSREKPSYFQAKTGAYLPLAGRYRVSARYSVEVWGNILEIPKNVETVVSRVFEVRPRGR